jgi:RNA polymerase sigma-70 factor (ECF subfamily)
LNHGIQRLADERTWTPKKRKKCFPPSKKLRVRPLLWGEYEVRAIGSPKRSDLHGIGEFERGLRAMTESDLFLRLFLQNERRVFAYIRTLLPIRSDVDDVFQEVSLMMWKKFDEQQPPADFAAWGCRIAYFKILEFCKQHRRRRVLFSEDFVTRLSETAVEQASALQLDERREALGKCLEKLSPGDRDLLAQRYAEGATTASAASQVGRSVDGLYKALARIRRALFNCVTEQLLAEGAR